MLQFCQRYIPWLPNELPTIMAGIMRSCVLMQIFLCHNELRSLSFFKMVTNDISLMLIDLSELITITFLCSLQNRMSGNPTQHK